MPDTVAFNRKWRKMSYEDRLKHVSRLCKRLLNKHLSKRWQFVVNTRCTNACGMCDLENKTIELSHWLIKNNNLYPYIYDILLHEIAHGIADSKHKEEYHHHNKKWKKIFISIGGSGDIKYPKVRG